MPFKILLFVFAGLSVGCASNASSSADKSEKRIKTGYVKEEVVFTPAEWPRALPATIYQPKGDGPWPGVLLIYGGSWNSAGHRWQMSNIARKLAKRGYVVMNATYRGTPEFIYPAPVEDLKEALRWLRKHSAQYKLDPNRIAAYGFSAGGHLAALLGTMDGPPDVRVQAVVAGSAPTDLTLFPGGEIVPRFLGATIEEKPDLFREASAVSQVTSDDPPAFIYHGTDDTTVSPEHSKVFKAALDRAGVRNELYWVQGRKHASMLIFNGTAEEAAIAFLDSVLR